MAIVRVTTRHFNVAILPIRTAWIVSSRLCPVIEIGRGAGSLMKVGEELTGGIKKAIFLRNKLQMKADSGRCPCQVLPPSLIISKLSSREL